MAVPLQTRIFWSVLSAVSGTPLMQLPADQVRAASDRRRRLVAMPGASLITGRAHRGVEISTRTAPVGEGVEVPIRVYRPSGSAGQALPLIVNYHGGGFIAGDPEQSEWWCSHVAHDVRALVVSVDYRLAPEHRFPVAPEDCYAVTVWAVEHAAELGADGQRLAVMGDSAGGNLAAVVCVMLRDRGGPQPALQVLLYPAVDLVNSYPSEDENEFAPVLAKADLHADDLYCRPEDKADPYVSPLLAEHTGLAPALVQTAEHDPLRDQGTAYAAALGKAGVEVRLTNYVDAVHGYISIPGLVPAARQALAEAVTALRDAFAR